MLDKNMYLSYILRQKGDYAMYNIIFYKDAKGNEPVKDYIVSLTCEKTKSNSVRLHKIQDYLNILKQCGTRAGMPYVRHLKGNIWELRPLKDRILFATYGGSDIVLLLRFQKKSKKAPRRKIKKANKLMKDYEERSKDNE